MSQIRVLVGTRKGAFILTSDGKREHWDVAGPHFGGRMFLDRQSVHHQVCLVHRTPSSALGGTSEIAVSSRATIWSRTLRRRILFAELFGSSGQISISLGRL